MGRAWLQAGVLGEAGGLWTRGALPFLSLTETTEVGALCQQPLQDPARSPSSETFKKGLDKGKISGQHWWPLSVDMGEAQLSLPRSSGPFQANRGAGVGKTLGIQENRPLPPCSQEVAVGSSDSDFLSLGPRLPI